MANVVGSLIALHGLFTLAIGSFAVYGAPVPSWLLRDGAVQLGGVLWIVAGVGHLLTAASVSGFILADAWRQVGLVAGVLGLAGLGLFFHPYFVIGIGANLAIIAAATIFAPTTRRILGV